MEKKANKWIGALLSFLSPPFGFLYVGKPRLALAYLAALLASFLLVLFLGSSLIVPWDQVHLLLVGGAAAHCYHVGESSGDSTERPWYSRWYSLASFAMAFALFAISLRAFFYEPFRTPSDSMRPAFERGDYFIVSKLGYGRYGAYGFVLRQAPITAPLRRGDAIVFALPEYPSTLFVKRLIGLPGDQIQFHGERLYLNGQPVSTDCQLIGTENRCVETLEGQQIEVLYSQARSGGDFEDVVPEGHYFLMGDNRNNAQDSRYFGFVPQENIVGRVIYRF